MSVVHNHVMEHLLGNEKLLRLLASVLFSLDDDVTTPLEKLVGDWEDLQPGQKVIITWSEPFRIEHGFIFTLPGFSDKKLLDTAIVQIPRSSEDEDMTGWMLLKYVAILADTVEIEDSYGF